MTWSSGLAVCLFVMIAMARSCFGKTQAQSGKFRRLGVNGERLSQPYKTVKSISRLACAYFCQNEGCVAFSHHAAESNCELTDEAGLAVGYQQTGDKGWVIYTSREPTVTRYTVLTQDLVNTNFLSAGAWTKSEFCPNGSFAAAYQMKIKPYESGSGFPPFPDNTALTAVRLTCEDQHGNITAEISSGQANCGNVAHWGMVTSCSTQGHYLTSLKLQVDHDGILMTGSASPDQTAANYMSFRCRDLESTIEEYEIFTPPGHGHSGTWGNWTSPCSRNLAVCGIKTRLKDEDDCAGVVAVILRCCRAVYV